MNTHVYTIEPAPRANPERRLDSPWNVVKRKDSPLGASQRREILARGFDRDNAEEKLQELASKLGLHHRGCNLYDDKPERAAPPPAFIECPNCGGAEFSIEGGRCPACKGEGRVHRESDR